MLPRDKIELSTQEFSVLSLTATLCKGPLLAGSGHSPSFQFRRFSVPHPPAESQPECSISVLVRCTILEITWESLTYRIRKLPVTLPHNTFVRGSSPCETTIFIDLRFGVTDYGFCWSVGHKRCSSNKPLWLHGIMNDFGWESMALVHFWLSHELNTVRLGVCQYLKVGYSANFSCESPKSKFWVSSSVAAQSNKTVMNLPMPNAWLHYDPATYENSYHLLG